MHARGAESESGRSEVAMAINASEDRERLLTLARGVKNIMGVARDRREIEKRKGKQSRRRASVCGGPRGGRDYRRKRLYIGSASSWRGEE